MKSPTVACASKVATRRVSLTTSGSTESADSGSSSLQDSSLSKEPTSSRRPIMPPPPPRIDNGDMGVGKVASQGDASGLVQQPVPPSPLAMVGRSGPADSPLVVRGASLKRWTLSPPYPPDAHPGCAVAPQTGVAAGSFSLNNNSDQESADPYSEGTSAYSLSNFLTDTGDVVPNPLQSGGGGAPDEWSDARARRTVP